MAKVLMEYEMLKRRRRVVDFDDLLCLPHRLLSQDEGLLHYYQDRFRYVLVDEFQDSSKVMVELVKLLSGNHQNIWVAGDDDQSIHGFQRCAGGHVHRVRKALQRYPQNSGHEPELSIIGQHHLHRQPAHQQEQIQG